VPVIGFGGSQGRVERVPVIFLHGNNDTPFPTACNPFGYIHNWRSSSSTQATARGSCRASATRAISAT